MDFQGTEIVDTFAEAFGMRYTRLIVTAVDQYWLEAAVREFTGYSASVIACDAETGVERWLEASETPDGRPGAALLGFGFSTEALTSAIGNRTGQCVMTCPTTSVFDGMEGRDSETVERMPLGKRLRFFGDGYQKSKKLGPRRFWRVPVMDGEFLVEDMVGVGKGVGGGNFILQSADSGRALQAARRAAEAIAPLPDVITPFPGGVARSGSKVGSRYKGLPASTADAYCPTLRGRVDSQLAEGVNAAYEVVIDGIHEQAVARAMVEGIQAAAGEGVTAITAGNYGGKLGKFHFHLHQLLATPAAP